MALLNKTTLQKSAGLLNATAPEDHFLAYITEGERDMLIQAGGKETATKSGINAYPGHHGQSGTSMGVSQGGSSSSGEGGSPNQGPAGGASAGGDYGGNINPSQEYAGHTVQDQRDYRADPVGFVEKNTNVAEPEKIGFWEQVSNVASNLMENSLTGKVLKLGGEVLGKLGEYSKDLQKKAMTYSLNNKITSIGKKDDFHPGAYGYKIQDIQKDLAKIQSGDFTQSDFNEKYGAPEISVGDGDGQDRDLMNIIAPAAPHIVGGTTPQESQAAKWYANLGGSSGGFNLTSAYAAAKSKVAQTLGNPSAIGQLAVNQSPFYDWLKKNSLNKGIL